MTPPAHRWNGFVRVALLAVVLCWPWTVSANPVSINPVSLIAFGIVAFWALVVEAGVVTILLLFSGVVPLRTMAGYLIANAAVFVFLFFPAMQERFLPLWLLEVGVVWLDATAIQMLSRKPYFQGDDYRAVSLRRSWLISLTGNAASFFVGILANGSPWVSK